MKKSTLKKRKWISAIDFAVIGGVLLICCLMLLFFMSRAPQGTKALISYDGKIIKELDLSSALDEVFVLEENPRVSFEINKNRIRFVNTACPDKLCENFGYLEKQGELAVCLPNRVSLKITGEKSEIDAIIGN